MNDEMPDCCWEEDGCLCYFVEMLQPGGELQDKVDEFLFKEPYGPHDVSWCCCVVCASYRSACADYAAWEDWEVAQFSASLESA